MSAPRRTVLLVLAGTLAVPAGAQAVGLPPTFSRSIVITGTRQGVRVERFEVATRTQAGGRVRVTVRVAAAATGGASRRLDLAVAPCTGGQANSPLCRPARTLRLTIAPSGTAVTRSVVVARPAARRDAIRVTLNAAGAAPVWQPEHVGGGGGSAEILLNGGTWRFRQGTWWGVTAAPVPGVALDSVSFNSRRYAWTGRAEAQQAVATTIGYTGAEPPRWTFNSTMRTGRPFSFWHTPSDPVQRPRATPRSLTYAAALSGGERLFTVTVPLPAWAG